MVQKARRVHGAKQKKATRRQLKAIEREAVASAPYGLLARLLYRHFQDTARNSQIKEPQLRRVLNAPYQGVLAALSGAKPESKSKRLLSKSLEAIKARFNKLTQPGVEALV